MFKGRRFTAEIILLAVRWELQFATSYRDLEHMLADQGAHVDRTPTPVRTKPNEDPQTRPSR